MNTESAPGRGFSLKGVGRLLLATALMAFVCGLPDSLRVIDCLILSHC